MIGSPVGKCFATPRAAIHFVNIRSKGCVDFGSSAYNMTFADPGKIAVKVLLDERQLNQGINKLADSINQLYRDRPLTVIGVLTGSIVFLADVIRKLEMPLRVGVVQARSYEGTERGSLSINADMMLDITGRDVLLVDDIFDTGHTLTEVIELMNDLGPTSLRAAVLLCKTGKQVVDWQPDFVAFDIPDEFVVGYGLDYNDEYRNLPYLASLEPVDISGPSS